MPFLSSIWLALRSVFWALVIPGVVAGYVPWRYFGLAHVRIDFTDPAQLLGLMGLTMGGGLLAACVWEFVHSGRGTLAPVDPPRELVIRGLYRYVRNPMYLSVTMIVLGEALIARSWPPLLYLAAWFAGANLFVIGYEEPGLRRRFGRSYMEYARRVGRWIPRFRQR